MLVFCLIIYIFRSQFTKICASVCLRCINQTFKNPVSKTQPAVSSRISWLRLNVTIPACCSSHATMVDPICLKGTFSFSNTLIILSRHRLMQDSSRLPRGASNPVCNMPLKRAFTKYADFQKIQHFKENIPYLTNFEQIFFILTMIT